MDTILKSLGIDQTLFIQLGLVVLLYAILRNLLFSKLQEILDLREAKTTKMEDGANAKIAQADKLSAKYKESIDQARADAFGLISGKKDIVTKREAEKLKAHDQSLESDLISKRDIFTKELAEKKIAIMQQADSLSQELVTKIVQ